MTRMLGPDYTSLCNSGSNCREIQSEGSDERVFTDDKEERGDKDGQTRAKLCLIICNSDSNCRAAPLQLPSVMQTNARRCRQT